MKQEPDGFADFWSLWRPNMRHTDGRKLARDTFAKLVSGGACPQDIVDGARYFLRNMKEREREFIPLSSTWLNRGAYEDFAESERAFQARQLIQQTAQPVQAVKPKLSDRHFTKLWETMKEAPNGIH